MTKSSNEKGKEIDLASQYRAIGIPAVKAALLSRTIVKAPTIERSNLERFLTPENQP
ncbi:hypothetical protein [Rhizobium leguminosarum]|uniref:hypothetical protein n=1 Tax=Rhizobium leguminosarum TaxID=384 RepID=UPI0012BC292F|nr:hypothetical protein [Rhizobium leguminosarum]WFT91138.1 hypothetical protein QA638_38825 [Rhizobium leguminosarum]